MALPNVFDKNVTDQLIRRIQALRPDTPARWGKMSVAQMLAHCAVTYEMVYENKHPQPNPIIRFLLKLIVKKSVVNEVHYKRGGQTAPAFVISDTRDFATEQYRLIRYINKTQQLGGAAFDGKASHSFGVLTQTEWNNMFYKHLDHHLSQFGV